MASSAKQFTVFLLIALSSAFHSHARESQFFNKVPSTTTTTTNVPIKEDPLNSQEQERDFLPLNENAYGLYGHESGQLQPSTTTTPAATTTTETPYNTKSENPLNKYLPKNYNPVAYVTQPEDIENSNSFTEESYNTRTNNNNNNYYNGGNSFNERPQGLSATRFTGGGSYSTTPNNRENYYNNGGRPTNYEPQGMSDTRFMANGEFHYDIKNEKYSSNHPYERLKGSYAGNEYSNKNYYGNKENSYDKYSKEGNYQDEFQDEADMP